MNISVLAPEREIFNGEIKAVKVPGVGGEFQILNNHAPLVSALDAGQVTIKKGNNEELSFGIERGFIEVLNNEVSLLVQGVEE
ncbi:MAG: ATP synthase F1 subunit epsilon [Saprospiraceae bacterium]